jgi:transcriptional regulator with XRE-family HTH domain
MKIGKNIKRIRKVKEISQKDLAGMLDNMPVSTLANYENNHRQPDVNTLNKIANALGVSLDTLTCNESFDREILNRSIQLSLKDSSPDNDIFMTLGWYADYDTLLSFNNNIIEHLPAESIKGLLNFIFEKSKDEFNKIYNDLIVTDVYNLDSELEDYCQQLYINIMNLLDFIDEGDKEFLEALGYIKDGKLISPIELNKEDESIPNIRNENKIIVPPVSFKKMKAKVDSVFPALDAEIRFLSDPNVEKEFSYSFDELAKQGGYQELLIIAIEKAIKDTLNDIKVHLESGDLFDGVSSWITKESPLYSILKHHMKK